MQRFLLLLIATFTLIAAPAAAAGTASDMWRVSQRSGDVRVIHNRLQPAAARIDAALSPGDVVVTGATGRATLTRGGDYIVIAPGSRLLLPAATQRSGMTSLIQEMGTLLFKVKRTGVPHFRVDTPMLAAVVKGTTFTVVVGADRSAVQVIEGAVQVSAVEGGMTHLVEGGKTVFVTTDNPASLLVADGATLHSTSVNGGSTVRIGGSGATDLTAATNLSAGLVRADLTATAIKPATGTTLPIADGTASAAAATGTVAEVVGVTPAAPVVEEVMSGVTTVAAAVPTATTAAAPIVTAVTAPVVTAITSPVVTAITAPVVTVITSPVVTAITAPVVTAITSPVVTAPVVTAPVVTAPVVTAPVVTAPVVVPIVPIIPVLPVVPTVPCLGCP